MPTLTRSLRITNNSRLALVGAGGKTTALFWIAGELLASAVKKSVLVTTTTHLAKSQASKATNHRTVLNPSDLEDLTFKLPEGIILLTGPEIEDSRLGGLSSESLQRLHEISSFHQVPLLIEADGSRRKPLKSPDEHEPAIPDFVDTVIVLAGLSAIGNPLSDKWVHRLDRFREVTGEKGSGLINASMILKMLLHPRGGLKNIPERARKIALLNQADTPNLQAQANAMADKLLGVYDSIVIAALEPPQSHDQNADSPAIIATRESVAGVILAAGASIRYGRPKQLLDWRGVPFIRAVATTALNAGLDPVIIVSGAHRTEIEKAVRDLPVVIAFNSAWESGQGSSIRTAMRFVREATGAAIFLLVDQPQIESKVLRALVNHHAANLPMILAPMVQDRRANPVLFDRDTFESLRNLENNESGRNLFSKFRLDYMPWHDDLLLLDVDTPDDYRRLREYQ